jgi:hypothetical protein
MGILRVEGAWDGAAATEPLRLVGAGMVFEQLPQPPGDAVFRAAFPLPVVRLDDLGADWSVEAADGESVAVE